MTTPTDTTSAPHYRWGGVCDGWRLLAGDDLSVIQERVPPGGSETWHRHEKARQFFFILDGHATLDIGEETLSIGPRQGVEVRPGLPHRFRNTSEADVLFLVVSSPSTTGDRLEMPSPNDA